MLLDAGFPDELDLEKFFPESDRLGHGKKHPVSGWADTHELVDELAAYEDAQEAADRTPSIPMIYLLADPPNYDGPRGYLDAYPKELEEFASRYSPGVVKKVQSGHYMEAAIPNRIVDELDKFSLACPHDQRGHGVGLAQGGAGPLRSVGEHPLRVM